MRGSLVFEGGVWDLLVIFFCTGISDFSGVVWRPEDLQVTQHIVFCVDSSMS